MNVHIQTDASPARNTTDLTPITIAYGDGIGPEIMTASLSVLKAAGARIAPEEIEIGKSVYERGQSAGIDPESWDSLRNTGVFFKAPITTPQGGGYKSLNVTVRKSLGMFANVRPCAGMAPFVPTKHPDMDVVIVRENEEDLYAGIEHRQTQDVYQCLKLVSEPGTERIIRYAFEYARANGRKKVSCFSKDNIMKVTDGLFHRTFDEIAVEYPEIETDHWIIDIGSARLAAKPEQFDVIVTANLYGDIISDIAAEIAGSVGLGASANIGEHCSMFEAIHGSAPDIAGQDIANPSGLLLAGVQMLVHLKQPDIAETIHNAWLKTIEDGVHTADIYNSDTSTRKVGTQDFAKAVIDRLGDRPVKLAEVSYGDASQAARIPAAVRREAQTRTLKGIDVFVCWPGQTPSDLAAQLQSASESLPFTLQMISNRGTTVWPKGQPETFKTDHWRCRFMLEDDGGHAAIAALMTGLAEAGIDFVKTEQLYDFDGTPGYSLGQGQ